MRPIQHRLQIFVACLMIGGAIAAIGAARNAAAATAGLSVENAWLRATPPRATVGGGFLTITNTTATPDRLTGITAPAIAAKVEMHRTILRGGVAEMRPVEGGLAIPAGGSVTFKPGGLHLMFLGLKAPLTEGSHVTAQLHFEKAGDIPVDFTVLGLGAQGAHQGGYDGGKSMPQDMPGMGMH